MAPTVAPSGAVAVAEPAAGAPLMRPISQTHGPIASGSPPAGVRSKLIVDQPDDPVEQAADDAAHAVGRGDAVPRQDGAMATRVTNRGLVARLGPAAPLPDALRSPLEQSFQRDLGHVQMHTGAQAERAAAGLGARAFAVGDHIAFGSGQYSPDTRSGLELTAHEVAHVVAGDEGVRRALVAYADLENSPGSDLRAVLIDGYSNAVWETDREEFRKQFLEQLDGFLEDNPQDDKVADGIKKHAEALIDVSLGKHNDKEKDAYFVLGSLAALEGQASIDELAVAGGHSLGLSLAITMLADDAAILLLQELIPTTNIGNADLTVSLFAIEQAASNAEARYRLEIEATLLALIEARQAWDEAPPGGHQQTGSRIAMLARRLLLLDAAIRGVQQIQPDQSAALDKAMQEALPNIAAIRLQSKDEAGSLTALGDDPSLLSPQTLSELLPVSVVALKNMDQLQAELQVTPDTAFPKTVDAATAQMVRQTAEAILAREREMKQLRDAVIPSSPTYDLQEFSAVYDRWRAFVSPEAQRRSPAYAFIAAFFDRDILLGQDDPNLTGEKRQEALEKIRTPYELLGTPGRWIEQASFSFGRYLSLTQLVPILARTMGGTTEDFDRELGALATARDPLKAWGSASKLGLTPRVEHQTPQGMRTSSLTQAAGQWIADASGRFTDVAAQPSPDPLANEQNLQRLYGPRAVGMRQPNSPILGLRAVDAREGWAYLVDVLEFTGRDFDVVAREQHVMPPEVVNYLAAVRAAYVMSSGPFQPTATSRSGSEVPIGDQPTREKGGLAAAQASATQNLLDEDALSRDDRRAFERDRKTVTAAPLGANSPSRQLIVDLEAYLNGYFKQHPEAAFRFAAVLVIAVKEQGLAERAREIISPSHLGEVAGFAVGIKLVTRILSARGLLGRIVGDALGKWLELRGTGVAAAIVGIGTFLLEMGDVDSLDEARAWATVTPAVLGDLSALIDTIVTHGVSKLSEQAINRIIEGNATTPRELAASVSDLARDPVVRKQMVDAIDGQLAELGQAGKHDTPEYRALEAFRHEVIRTGEEAQSKLITPEVARALDEPLPGLKADTDLTAGLEFAVPRTAAERVKLDEAIPVELRDRVRVVEDPLLSLGRPVGQRTEVRVIPGETEVQIRVARDADAAAVAAHIPAARDLARFTGLGGRIRRLAIRIQDRLGLQTQPGPHQRGYEAQREVEKLERMLVDLRARQDWLESAENAVETGRRLTDVERADLDYQIASIERQIAFHARDLGSFEAGRGYIAVGDRQSSIRDAVEAALVAGKVPRAAAKQRADHFIRDARTRKVLDAVEDLTTQGVLQRIANAGGSLNTMLDRLQVKGGYRELIDADRDLAAGKNLFGEDVAKKLQAHRTAPPAQTAIAAAADVAAEWPVNTTTGAFDATKLPKDWTPQRIGQYAARRTPPPDDVPRLVFRRWRYVQTRKEPLPFNEWVALAYQANLNRQVSSPHENVAVRAREAFPNNLPETVGGRVEYDYEEWTVDGVVQASRLERGGARKGETLRYETTRPDGIRPKKDGSPGFDVVEHKHMTGTETVLYDSIQFRAQSEMARTLGKNGTHEIVITSDKPLGTDGNPAVEPSGPLGKRSTVFYFDTQSGQITHQWKNGAWGPPE